MKNFFRVCNDFALRLLIASGNIVGIFTLLGYFGKNQYFFDLLSHFRVQYSCWLLFLMLLCFVSKRRIYSLIFSLFLLANAVDILPYFAKVATVSSSQSSRPLRLLQMNLWAHRESFPQILQTVKSVNPDIISFQELTGNARDFFERNLKASYPYFAMSPQEDCFGIGIASRVPLQDSSIIRAEDANGNQSPPMVAVRIGSGADAISIISAHLLPPLSSRSYLGDKMMCDAIIDFAKAHNSVILIGDLNLSQHSSLFKRLEKETKLKDSMRGFGWQASYPTFFMPLRIPIDQCLHSADLCTVSRRLGPFYGSDHFPVILEIERSH